MEMFAVEFEHICCMVAKIKSFFFLRSILFFQSNTLFRREVDQKLNCLINTIFTKK